MDVSRTGCARRSGPLTGKGLVEASPPTSGTRVRQHEEVEPARSVSACADRKLAWTVSDQAVPDAMRGRNGPPRAWRDQRRRSRTRPRIRAGLCGDGAGEGQRGIRQAADHVFIRRSNLQKRNEFSGRPHICSDISAPEFTSPPAAKTVPGRGSSIRAVLVRDCDAE